VRSAGPRCRRLGLGAKGDGLQLIAARFALLRREEHGRDGLPCEPGPARRAADAERRSFGIRLAPRQRHQREAIRSAAAAVTNEERRCLGTVGVGALLERMAASAVVSSRIVGRASRET